MQSSSTRHTLLPVSGPLACYPTYLLADTYIHVYTTHRSSIHIEVAAEDVSISKECRADGWMADAHTYILLPMPAAGGGRMTFML